MKERFVYTVLAALTFAAPAAAEPRLAQAIGVGVLPPYEIMTIIRSTGLDPLVRPVRRGANYVLHAIGRDRREVRVVVRARTGRIVSVTPVAAPSPLPPRGVTMGPYEPAPPDYIPPGPPEVYEAGPAEPYEAGPRIIYEAGPPAIYGPPESIPGAPPRARTSAPRAGIAAPPPDRFDDTTGSVPRVITAIEPDNNGLLPPPPDRFPRRAPPTAAKPAPVKRAVAALPKQPPLPRPRPAGDVDASPAPETGTEVAPVRH